MPNHSDADIERGLHALAVHGDAEKASSETGISARTIRDWRKRHAERFADICRDHARALTDHRFALSRRVWEALGKSIEVLQHDATLGLEAKDRATAARALTAIAETLDKTGRLDAGTPTEIAETQERPASEVLSERERLDREIDAALADPALRAEFERRLARRSE